MILKSFNLRMKFFFKRKRRKILCSSCKTGMDSYILDESSPVCPYLGCYNGRRCTYYVPLENKKKNIFSRIVN